MKQKVTLFLTGFLVFFLFLTPFLINVNIECRSQFGNCPNEVTTKLSQFNRKNLFQARQKSSDYLKKNLTVSDFSMQYRVPDALLVNLLVKKPEFAILDKATDTVGLIDSGGRIISILPNSPLPTVAVSGENLEIGKIVSGQEFFALKLMQGIWQMYQVHLGDLQDSSLVVELPGQIKVILPDTGDRDILLGELRLVYGKVQGSESPGRYSQIDLRFKNPVLR